MGARRASAGLVPTTAAMCLDPVLFADTVITKTETGKDWRVVPHHRRVLGYFFERAYRIRILSEVKKSAKTFTAGWLCGWWAATRPDSETIIAANDYEQAQSRVYGTLAGLIKHNPALGALVRRVLADRVEWTNGAVTRVIAADWRGAAGSRHSLAVVDEPWAITEERAERLIEELTPIPTEPEGSILFTTTAGILGESRLLERYYERGLGGVRLDEELEVYAQEDLVMFWSHTPRMPWQVGEAGAKYYAEQARALRPGTFARLHRNEWAASESIFITPELWDGAVDEDHHPLLPTKDRALFVGVDAGIKHDTSAVVAVYREDDWLALALHRIWVPGGTPIDLEETIEAYLLALHSAYHVQQILCDPYQLHRSITTLRAAGLPVEEFPQTQANTVRMGQGLYELLKGVNLRLYPSEELRAQALHTVAIESPRGFRIAKEKASKKIDAIVACSMACVAALDAPKYVPPILWGG